MGFTSFGISSKCILFLSFCFIVTPVAAVASQCPDIPRADYSLPPIAKDGFYGGWGAIDADYWIISTKVRSDSINGVKTLDNLSKKYFLATKPSYKCYNEEPQEHALKYLGGHADLNNCITSDGKRFKGHAERFIPNKSGSITHVVSQRIGEKSSVSCKRKTYIRYQLYAIFENIRGNQRLPIIVAEKLTYPINVKSLGPAPSF